VTNGHRLTRQIAESVNATGMPENASAAQVGGGIARKARQDLESRTGRPVISGENALPPRKAIKGPRSAQEPEEFEP
jgi:DNA-damage-inducible protein D